MLLSRKTIYIAIFIKLYEMSRKTKMSYPGPRSQNSFRKLEQEGLFSRRFTDNVLADPRILQHLRIVAQEAEELNNTKEDNTSVIVYNEDEEDEEELERMEMKEQIEIYNKVNNFGTPFKILQKVMLVIGRIIFLKFDWMKFFPSSVKQKNNKSSMC